MKLRAALGILTLCGVLVASGCGGGDPEAGPQPSTGGSSGSSSPAPTGPTATPASGKLLATSNASIHAPQEWPKRFDLSAGEYVNYSDKNGLSSVTLADLGVGAPTGDPRVELRKTALRGQGKAAASAPIDTDTTLDGVMAAHVAYHNELFHIEVFGAFRDGAFVWLMYRFYTDVSRAERRQVVEEGLASFQWK